MKNKNVGSKKINNKQQDTDGNGSNPLAQSEVSHLQSEVEIDANGHQKTVQRARNMDETSEQNEDTASGNLSSNPTNMTEKQAAKMVENKDRNSDITPNRYPNEHPDNHENRGNIKND